MLWLSRSIAHYSDYPCSCATVRSSNAIPSDDLVYYSVGTVSNLNSSQVLTRREERYWKGAQFSRLFFGDAGISKTDGLLLKYGALAICIALPVTVAIQASSCLAPEYSC